MLATSLRPLAANEMDDQDEDEAHAHQQQTKRPQNIVLGRALGIDCHRRGERGGDGRGRRQQRRRHGLDAADDHAHGECLAKGARHAKDDRSHERRHGGLEHHVPDGLPAGVAQRERALTVAVGHGAQAIDRKGGHRRQDHDSQHDGAGQDAQTRAHVENGLHKSDDHVKANQSKDDRGNAGQKLNKRLKDLGTKLRLDLDRKDGRADGDGQRDERGEHHDCKRGDDQGQGAGIRQAVFGRVGQVPLGAGKELDDRDAVLDKSREALLGDHEDKRGNDKRHERYARARDAQAHVLKVALWQLFCHCKPFRGRLLI